MCWLSLVSASGRSSSLQRAGFTLQWLLLSQSTGCRHESSGSCGMESALGHVGSSWTRDRTCVPRIGRWILNHRASRGVLSCNSRCLVYTICCHSDGLVLPKIIFDKYGYAVLLTSVVSLAITPSTNTIY